MENTIDINNAINSQLQKVEQDFNLLFEGTDMKKHLTSLKKKYAPLKIQSLEDKDIYEDIKKAISVVRPLRTNLEKKVKEANADAKIYIAKVKELGDKFQGEIAKVEDPLWAEREKFEALEKEESVRLAQEKEDRKNLRLAEISQNGCQFNGSWWGINDIQVGVQMIEEMDDTQYDDFIEKVKVQNEINVKEAQRKQQEQALLAQQQEDLRIENERKQKELDDQRAIFEKQQADFKAQQDLLAKQQQDLRIANEKAQKDAEARELAIQKEKEEKAKQEKLEAERKLLAERALPYEKLGFKHNYTKGTWEISIGQLYSLEITKVELISDLLSYDIVSKNVSEYRAKEEARLAEVEKQKEEERIKLMNEKDAYNDYITRLLNVQAPNLENEQLKNSINSIVSLFKPIN